MKTLTAIQSAEAFPDVAIPESQSLYDMLKLASEMLEDPAHCEKHGGQTALSDHLERNHH